MYKSPLDTNSLNSLSDGITKSELEKAIITSETRYRRLFESAQDGILIIDAETGKIVDVNPFLIDMLGYSKKEFIEKLIWEIGAFKDIYENKEKFLELQQNEYIRYDDLPLETAKGRKIIVEFISNSYFEDHKKVIQCNIRETTFRKQSEWALRKSESHLRTLLETIPDLIWLKDTNGVYLSCNPMFERFFGAREAEIVGKTDYDFVDRELADFFRENDRKAMDAGKPTSNEEWVTFADDGHRAFLDTIKTPIYDSDGTLLGILGIGRDITERMLAGQKLQASENRFRAIFDQAPVAMALLDLQGHPIVSNLRLTKMIGYSSDELAKMIFTEFTYAEDICKDLNQFTDLIAGKISEYRIEKRYIHKNGNIIWANLFVTTLNDNNGLPQEIIGMVEDITEQKQGEEKLKNSEERFKIIFDYAPDAYYLTDLKGTFIDGNIAAAKMLGYNKNELIGENFFKLKLISPDQFLKATALLAKNLLGKATGPDEFVLNKKNGSKITVEISAYPVKIQDQSIVLGIARDVTGRKLAEKEIAMLAHSLKSINECVSITDLENKILFVNESFLKTYGYEPNELIGKNISIVRSQSNEQAQLDEILTATIQGSWNGELMNRKKDGTEFPVYLSTTLIKVEENKVLGLIGVALDISERKRAEMELVKAKEKAEESDRLKTAFLANISHEIRTPMNGILGFTELIRTEGLKGEEQQQYIAHLEKSGIRLLNLLNDIISFSIIESQQTTVSVSETNINEQVEYIYHTFKSAAEQKELHFSFQNELTLDKAIISTDKEKLFVVLTNLVNNAIKFTQTGFVELGYAVKGDFVEFYVKDSGPGISDEQKIFIFERFRQGSDSLTRNYEGAGLGLSISKAYVEMLGGKIWVENNTGKNGYAPGSTFYFTIPVSNLRKRTLINENEV